MTVLLAGCTATTSQHPTNPQSVRATSKVQPTPATHRQAIKITVNGVRLTAHLNNSSAARAFAQELPVDLTFRNFMDMPEKIADLHHTLPTTGMPSGHAGTAGSIGYWSPDKRIVFYWGTEDYYEGIHIIGTFDHHDYKKVVRKMAKNTTVKIEKVNTNEN
ncbi:cyclophilin-like fold protein [Lactiplantibacillus garii]|uniref:cyclophilin-like fold protein n=1 Tax=Lactiplantibacillus garii TaxID=2306423 RepID=UPI00131544D7|nr:cyclophilin-like fold protein [Lactiplantibacillus garii]